MDNYDDLVFEHIRSEKPLKPDEATPEQRKFEVELLKKQLIRE